MTDTNYNNNKNENTRVEKPGDVLYYVNDSNDDENIVDDGDDDENIVDDGDDDENIVDDGDDDDETIVDDGDDASDNIDTSYDIDVNKIRNEVHSNIKEHITLISNVSCNISYFYVVPTLTILLSTFLCCNITFAYSLIFFLNYLLLFAFNSWDYIMEYTYRKRVIKDINGDDYLQRYYVFLKDRVSSPFNIFIHKFLLSDTDDMHNHPWSYITIILKGGYWEETFVDNDLNKERVKKWCGPGYFQYVDANHIHRITLKDNVDCWTLFIPFSQKQEWGFYKFAGKNYEYIEHETYKKRKRN